MIKTIKVKKQLRLDELIKYIFDNGIKDESFLSDIKLEPNYEHKNKVYVHTNGTISLGVNNLNRVTKDDMYTVEVEEEITEGMVFQDIVILHIDGISHLGQGTYHSIRSIRRDYPTVAEIHAKMVGKIQLIWEVE